MRRFALSVLTACGLALLTACGSGGGYGFSTGTNSNQSIDSVVFSTSSNQTNDFFVTPGGTSPLQVNAVGQKGSGPTALVVPDATFTWAARFVNASDPPNVASYLIGPAPGARKPCPAYAGPTPAVPILQQNLSSPTGFAPLPSGQAANTVYIGAVPGATPPYCLVLQATHLGDGVQGAVTVVVSSSP
jgi:hypothetical protein